MSVLPRIDFILGQVAVDHAELNCFRNLSYIWISNCFEPL